MIAPAAAGGLLAVVAPAQAVVADAASYLASAVLLVSIRRPFEVRDGSAGRRLALAGMLEGLRFIWRNPLLRAMTLLAGTPVSVTGGAGTGLIVIYAVRALGLAETVFADSSDRIVAAWRARAARMYPSDFADCPDPVRYTLLAALCWTRQAELVDGLVELLTGLPRCGCAPPRPTRCCAGSPRAAARSPRST